MDTRWTTRAQDPGEDDNEGEAVQDVATDVPGQPLPAPTPAGQSDRVGTSADELALAHSRLAELLYAAAAMLEQITRLGPGGAAQRENGQRPPETPAFAMGLRLELPATGTVGAEGGAPARHAGGGAQPACATSSAGEGRSGYLSAVARSSPADDSTDQAGTSASPMARPLLGSAIAPHTVQGHGTSAGRSSETEPTFQQRLPALQVFVSSGGDWGGFQRRFVAHQEMAGWTDNEALCALPAMLDGDALGTLTAAPRSARSMLQSALQVLATVYGPPSDCRQLFYERQKGDKESPLEYRTALLALVKAAFPRMDEEGIDAMVAEKILLLADDLNFVILVQDDADMSSLRAARHIHANLISQQRKANKAAAGHTVAATTSESEGGFAAGRSAGWRSGGRPARDVPSHREQPKSSGALVVCYNCGLRGDVASGCRAPRQRGARTAAEDGPLQKPPQHPPASRGTPHALVARTVRVPPGAQMLVPLRLRRPFAKGVSDQGIMLGPSRAGVNGPDLVTAETIVKGDEDPFIVVLNVGTRTAVVSQGTVFAHAIPVPVETLIIGQVATASQPRLQSDIDEGWLESLCAETPDLSVSFHA
ncbi:unnamed protein product [Lampetra fluviatilis]